MSSMPKGGFTCVAYTCVGSRYTSSIGPVYSLFTSLHL